MTDMNILFFGIVVFGLMSVGLVLTVLEFRQISEDTIAERERDSETSSPRTD